MSLLGTRLGPYEITAQLGEGGMGVVYRAQDSHLKREVALKVLPEGLTADPERRARFEREAKLLASLNHPNIAQIHGLEVSGETRALVMELIEGPTLAERLDHGALPLDECLSIARQIAEALEAAHEKGIVHRDLKPQNIKASVDGRVKVLDFGLAKALDAFGGASTSEEMAHSPTVSFGGTREGVILGTAPYMAPEQARGGALDKRTDIWAFGVVLHEMLCGERLFVGDSVVDVLGSVMRQPIDFDRLPATTPRRLRELLRRCLERNPRNRLHDIADARIVLDELLAGGAEELPVAAAPPRQAPVALWRRLAPWAAAVSAAVVAVALWVDRGSRAPADAAVAGATWSSFRQLTFLPGGEATPALSPDGESLVYSKQVNGQLDLFLQRVDGRNPVPLTASCPENDSEPAFSPDGRRIAYHSECGGGGIFVMGATGESARRVTDSGYSPAWSPNGRELAVVTERPKLPYGGLFTRSELWAVEIETGARRRVSEHDARHPSWSPDGKRIAFWGRNLPGPDRDLWTVAADGSESKEPQAVSLIADAAADWNPVWSPDGGWLYFSSTRGGTLNLWRLRIDGATGQRLSDPEPALAPSSWAGWISFARDGRRLAYVDRNLRTSLLRAPFDSARGELVGPPRVIETGSLEVWSDGFDLSPDGSSALFATTGMPQHLILANAEGSELRQLTEGQYRNRQAKFSPDGRLIALQTTRFPNYLALLNSDGSGLRELLTDEPEARWPTWSPDGRRVAANGMGKAYVLAVGATVAAGSTTPLPAAPDGLEFLPTSWSQDGKLLSGELSAGADPRGVGIFSFAEAKYRKVAAPHEAIEPRFLRDSRRLVWLTKGNLVLHDPESGASRVLRSVAPGRELASHALSRDGKWIAWLEIVDESDIWLAESAP